MESRGSLILYPLRYMNKKVVVAIAIVIALILIVWFLMGRQADDQMAGLQEATPAESAEMAPEGTEADSGMTDWLKAIAGGQKLSCTYTMGEGENATEVKMDVDGKKYRSQMSVGGMETYVLSDGQTVYSWTPSTKQGFKMDLSCLESLKGSMPEGNSQPAQDYKASSDEVLRDMPDIRCDKGGAVDLSLPSDITFTDQCAMMQNAAEMMKQYQDKLPAGVTVPGMPSAN